MIFNVFAIYIICIRVNVNLWSYLKKETRSAKHGLTFLNVYHDDLVKPLSALRTMVQSTIETLLSAPDCQLTRFLSLNFT